MRHALPGEITQSTALFRHLRGLALTLLLGWRLAAAAGPAARSADERGAGGDQALAAGKLRAAPRERDLEVGVSVFCQGARPRPTEVSRYVDEHRGRFGVEPICKTLGVSVSAYYARRNGRRSDRAVEDEQLLSRIRELHAANYYAYGYRRMWKALRRAGEHVPRCRVQRLMKSHGIQGAKWRGKPWRTTKPDPNAARRPDLVQRDFTAGRPNELWVA